MSSTSQPKTQIQRDARFAMFKDLASLQDELRDVWIDKSIPDDWDGMDIHAPVERHKTRVTIRLDSDMVRWFRKLGPNYGMRLNRILRVYWMALISGRIKSHYDEEDTFPLFLEYIGWKAEKADEQRRREAEE